MLVGENLKKKIELRRTSDVCFVTDFIVNLTLSLD